MKQQAVDVSQHLHTPKMPINPRWLADGSRLTMDRSPFPGGEMHNGGL